MSDGILSGVRVVDLAWGLAGSLATQLLAEAGADVIKVEPPAGDPLRATIGFATWNRSKRSVVLRSDNEHDRAALFDLLAGADALVHSLPPAAALAAGLDDRSLGERFPRLIVASAPGYPVDHPDVVRPGYDILVQARMGLMDEQRGQREGPIFLRFPVPSWGAVYLLAIGLLARLLARERTGRGGVAHTSLLQGALLTMTMHWARAEKPDPAFAAGLPKDMQPTLFECADGVWIHVMAATQAVPLVAETIAALDPVEVERMRSRRGSAPVYFGGDGALLEAAYRKRPSAEWLEALWAADVPVLPAQTLGDILLDAQGRENGYVVAVDDPEWGRTLQAGPPFHTKPPSVVRGPAPRLGEHTDEVLSRPRDPLPPSHGEERLRYPLEGLRVLDLGCFLAGPFAAMLLADLGADVIKVEAPRGDPMRPVSRVFAGCQRGKRGVALDLKRSESRPVLEALVGWADVLHHNLREPAARRLGIDYPSLRPLNPGLVYCRTSSYGPRGPRANWPGFDQLFQAYSGWEVEGAGEANPPMWHRMGMMDHQNALASVVATLLALWRRARSGAGQEVSASILGASTLTSSETLIFSDGSIAPYERLDHEQTGIAPGYAIYPVADGWVAVAAVRHGDLQSLCKVAGVDAPEQLGAALRGWAADELVETLDRARVPAERVRLDNGPDFLERRANRDARLVVSYPQRDWGQLDQIGAFWFLGDLELQLDRAPPGLGEHTRSVLGELGFDAAAIERLAGCGAIGL